MPQLLLKKNLYGITNIALDNPRVTHYSRAITDIIKAHHSQPLIADIYIAMLHIIVELDWEGACHPSSSILYILYKELGFNPTLKMGEVQIDHRYFDHSWVEIDGSIIDASLISPINKSLGLNPIFLDINLDTLEHHQLTYGAVSSLGLSEFTEIIYHRPFHKYMNPFPWGLGKWAYVEAISNYLELGINVHSLLSKYKYTKRTMVRNQKKRKANEKNHLLR